MRWTKRRKSVAATAPSRRPVARVTPTKADRRAVSACALALIAFSALLLSGSTPEKHLAIYSVAANYSLPLLQHDGRDYVGLLELLEPLGRVSAKLEGSHWRIQYDNVEGNFQIGKSHARVQGREADLGGKFWMENQRGLVPVASLGSLLPRILGGPVTLHADSDRLFIGNVATHFTASLASENPPRLVFRFSAAVNPTIATEAGVLHMTFTREPLVAPASSTLTFGSKAIPSATYSEGNGMAVIAVTSTVPVMASFSSDRSTITVSPTSAPPQKAALTPAVPPAAPQSATSPATAPATAPMTRRYFAVVDASHGGDDHGETLSPTLLEKDVTVALAHSLRQELESRGITTLVLRDSDANLSADQRAAFANADHAAIYIALHAASTGHGVRIYTALLPYGEGDRGPFRSWTTAQRAALNLSQSTAAAVSGELLKRQIAVRVLAAPLRPLNNITGAAIAVELAPQGSDISQLSAPDYQQLVTSSIATAIAAAHEQLAAQ